jgi:hypothetical protein
VVPAALQSNGMDFQPRFLLRRHRDWP